MRAENASKSEATIDLLSERKFEKKDANTQAYCNSFYLNLLKYDQCDSILYVCVPSIWVYKI